MKSSESSLCLGWVVLAVVACSSPDATDAAVQPGPTATGGSGGVAGAAGGSAGAPNSSGAGGTAGSNTTGASGAAGVASGGVGGVGVAGGGTSSGGSGAGGNAGSGGAGPANAGKLTIMVDGIQMGDRLCFRPEASNSGGNHSPKIDWIDVPPGTQSLALTMYDQTNKTPHRIVCNLPPTLMGQPADIKAMLPDGAQASTGHSKPGNAWYGPGAGGNAHAYEIAIWALATPTLEGGCNVSGADATRAVYDKLKSAPPTLVLASDAKVLWGNVDGKCTP
ncbi:MAG TPA: hypothetical protein VHP33_02180 [Polyangiaceae bacterium]|nr:hypothetical protein [Polyangiaceae bacterium]